MLYVVVTLYVAGGLLSLAGVLRGYFVTLKPARLYKEAKAIEERTEAEWRERRSKATTPQEHGAADVWKGRQMEARMNNGKSVLSTIRGSFFGGFTEEALAYYANKDSAWDVVLVGLGTLLVSVASVWSLFLTIS